MEAEEISVNSDYTARNIQKIISCKKKVMAETLNKNIVSLVTEKDILEMFENNKQYMEYFISLKDAVVENRIKGDNCLCDPRDLQMKERLELARWKPRVVIKLDGDEANSEEFGFSNKQVAVDENDHNKEVEDCADMDVRLKNGGHDCGTEKDEESFRCGLHGCKQRFSSLASYESHYHNCHNHVCAACKNSFVSNFLLDVHLQETHDSYFQILSPRIDMYRCLVESCQLKFRTPDLRKDHLVSVHKLPANFMFHKPMKIKGQKSKRNVTTASMIHCTGDNIESQQDLSSSLLISQPSSPSPSMEIESGDVHESGFITAAEKIGRNGARGRGKKVPQIVCFGRGSRRAFQNHRHTGKLQHWHQMGAVDMDTAVDIEKVDFADMIDSLQCAE